MYINLYNLQNKIAIQSKLLIFNIHIPMIPIEY